MLKLPLSALALAALPLAPVAADVITFDDLAFDSGPAKTYASFVTGDYRFTALLASEPLTVRARNDTNNADPAGATLGITPVGNDPGFRFERVDGAAFDLTSLDLTQFNLSASNQNFSGYFRLFLDGSSTAAVERNFDGAPPFQTFALAISGVHSVRLTGINFLQVDNLVVSGGSSPLPEPATWAMLVIGFAAIGRTLRRGRVQPRIA